ncbi:MAG: c-type cytochrome [Thermoleophilia bacterium]
MRMTPRIIIIGGLAVVLSVIAVVVFLPFAIFKPADTLYVRPYTEAEQRGRDLYVSNGCVYCHSQFTRPDDVTPSEPSQAGDFNYDKPHQLGTLRTGPDLANIGLKRGDQWEIDHLIDPRKFTPNSIMPSFKFLSESDLRSLVAYLNTLGNKQTASTNLMIPDRYHGLKQPMALTIENWDKGRDLYAERCLTCHGPAGKGDGPYAMINNARPADLRQPRFTALPPEFFFWRISEGVPGTVMPKWHLSLAEDERWLVTLYVQNAFMDMVPHLTDEGDLPAEYDIVNPLPVDPPTLDEGKAIYVAYCQFCHGYGGRGNGVDAAGLRPTPPDFNDPAFYSQWKDGDWFWRVSESLPMRAMPKWKKVLDERQRWAVANYVRYVLALPDPEAEPADPVIPEAATTIMVMPENASVAAGRFVYMKRCWMCHGDAGQGEGPDAVDFVPAAADFTVEEFDTMPDYELMWKVTEGIPNTAMPIWRLLLSEEDRWNAIAYIKATFISPTEPTEVDDNPPVAYQAIDPAPYENTPDARERGKVTYEKLCLDCHGATARGDGKYGPALAPTPANLTEDPAITADEAWWFWRVSEGVVGDQGTHPTAMPPWHLVLSEQERWEVAWYARELVGIKEAPAP